MKNTWMFIVVVAVCLGCARVNIATKDPIKVDVTMRVDVYQHVADEVKSIEDQIYDDGAWLFGVFGITEAYAADSLQTAIDGRKARRGQVEDFLAKGYIGLNRKGYLELRAGSVPSAMMSQVEDLVKAENRDRREINRHIAGKNGVDIAEPEKITYREQYDRAPAGAWCEVSRDGRYVWEQKP